MTVYLICYAACFLLSVSGHHLMAGAGLIAAAGWLYVRDWKNSGTPLHLRGLFAFSFVGGEGLALLKLSRICGTWTTQTWLSFLLTYVVFHLVYGAVSGHAGKDGAGEKAPEMIPAEEKAQESRWHNFGIFLPIAGLSFVVLLAFVFEVIFSSIKLSSICKVLMFGSTRTGTRPFSVIARIVAI